MVLLRGNLAERNQKYDISLDLVFQNVHSPSRLCITYKKSPYRPLAQLCSRKSLSYTFLFYSRYLDHSVVSLFSLYLIYWKYKLGPRFSHTIFALLTRSIDFKKL